MTLIEWRVANLPTTQRVGAKIIASARNRRPQSAQSVRIGKEIQERLRPQLSPLPRYIPEPSKAGPASPAVEFLHA